MTTLNREALLKRVRALLSKTQENGCTEEEALAALTKARAMIDAYEISDDELALTKKEKAIFTDWGNDKADKNGIRNGLAVRVAEFADCRVYRNHKGGLTFVGLPSDIDLATWLLDSLQTFVQGELAAFLMAQTSFRRGERRRLINGFVGGACSRINQRLADLMAARTTVTDNSRALVVVKKQLVADALRDAGIHLRKTTSRRVYDDNARLAGRAAGDRASFGKPVNAGGSSTRLLS